MSTYIELAKEAIRQFPKSSKYIFSYETKMRYLDGFYSSVMRRDKEYYSIECFVREKENCVVIRLYLPFSYEEERWEYVSCYLECINKSQKVKSDFAMGTDQTVEVCRCIGYEDHALTVEDLEQTLAEMIVDAELFFPVIKAIGLGKPIPSDVGELPWVFHYVIKAFDLQNLPCDKKEASRLYFEEYMESQKMIEERKMRLHSRSGSDDFTAEDDDVFRDILSIFNAPDDVPPDTTAETNQADPEKTEDEHVIEIGDEDLDFCGTLKDRKHPSRFDDPEFRERFFHLMDGEEW